jgi:hypothetical protein
VVQPTIPVLRQLRQEDHQFKAILGYMARPYLKKKNEKNKTKQKTQTKQKFIF